MYQCMVLAIVLVVGFPAWLSAICTPLRQISVRGEGVLHHSCHGYLRSSSDCRQSLICYLMRQGHSILQIQTLSPRRDNSIGNIIDPPNTNRVLLIWMAFVFIFMVFDMDWYPKPHLRRFRLTAAVFFVKTTCRLYKSRFKPILIIFCVLLVVENIK